MSEIVLSFNSSRMTNSVPESDADTSCVLGMQASTEANDVFSTYVRHMDPTSYVLARVFISTGLSHLKNRTYIIVEALRAKVPASLVRVLVRSLS